MSFTTVDLAQDRRALASLDELMRAFDALRRDHAAAATNAVGNQYRVHSLFALRWARWRNELAACRGEIETELR